LPLMLSHPFQFPTMLYCMLVSQSWNWQFRPPYPPVQLLRQTWDYVPASSKIRLPLASEYWKERSVQRSATRRGMEALPRRRRAKSPVPTGHSREGTAIKPPA